MEMKINLQSAKWIYNSRKKKYLYCYHPVGVNLMRLMAT
ncbi:dipicolinate synthase, partial [Bacillus cereus]